MKPTLMVFQRPKETSFYPTRLPPLGILYVASYLESKGIPVEVIDCQVQELKKNFANYPNIFFTVNICNMGSTLNTIKEAKKQSPDSRIIIGGPISLSEGKRYLSFPEIDAVVIGEGELTAYEYITSKDKKKVKGLILRGKDNKPFFTGERRPMKELDKLPFPALDKVPINRYYSLVHKAEPISSIITSRGCPGECIFCLHPKVWRQRSVKNVVDEIEWQVNELGAKELAIFDDNFTLNRQRVLDICDEIIRRGIKFRFQLKGGVRADKIDRALLVRMKEAGLWLVGVAPETGNRETLKRIKKGFSLEQVKNVVKWSKELNLVTHAFFTIGYPWETRKHLIDTIRFSEELDTDFIHISRVLPLEGTPLYDLVPEKPKTTFKDQGVLHGGMKHNNLTMPNKEMHKFLKRAYRNYYLHPKRFLRIMKTLSLKDCFILLRYSLASNSI